MARPPVRPLGQGRYRIALPDRTRDLIVKLCDELEALLDSDSELLVRLFPPPYGDDTERNEGYAALARPELIEHRKRSLAVLRESSRAEELQEDQLMAWMRALNDLRLVLGSVVGIDTDDPDIGVHAELAETYALYEFLGGLLDLIVGALAEGLPAEGGPPERTDP